MPRSAKRSLSLGEDEDEGQLEQEEDTKMKMMDGNPPLQDLPDVDVLQLLDGLDEVLDDGEVAVGLHRTNEVDLTRIPSVLEALALAQLGLHLLRRLNHHRSEEDVITTA